jgi:hypothetical protein
MMAQPRRLSQYLTTIRWPLALLVVIIIIGLAAPFWNVPLNRDQGVYATCADILLHGGVPYRDCWDTKGPAQHYTYALARLLFGSFTGGAYILNAFAIAITALVLAAIAHHWFVADRLELAYGVGLFYSILAIAVRFDMNAQPESFANLFAMLGLLGITRAYQRDNPTLCLWSGGSLAWAVLYKYALILPFGAVALALIFLHPTPRSFTFRWRIFAVTLASAVGIVTLFALYLIFMGAFDDAVLHIQFILFYFPKAQLNPDEYALRSLPLEQTFLYVMRLPIIWAASLIGTVLAIARRRWAGGVCGIFILSSLIVVWGQQRFTPYHWTVCLPAFALGIGLLIYELLNASLSPRTQTALIGGLSLAILANAAYFFYQDQWLIMGRYIIGVETKQEFYETHGTWDHAVAADYIRERTNPGDPIWVWGHHTAIYAISERLPSTPFIYNEPLLMHINGGHPWKEQWRAEALDDIYENPPVYLLLTTFDRTFFDFQNPNVAWEEIPEYNHFTSTYYLKEYEFGRFQFYHLIPYWSRQNRPELLDQVTVIDLINQFDQATIEVPSDPAVEIIPFTILNEPGYDTIRLAPPGQITYQLDLPESPICLRVDTVMYQDSWAWGGDGASFLISITPLNGDPATLLDEYISNAPEDQHWHPHLIDLNAYAGQTVNLSFATNPGPSGDFVGDWAGWGSPRIVRPPSGDRCDTNAIVDSRP